MGSEPADLAGTATITATLTPAGIFSNSRFVDVRSDSEAARMRMIDAVQRNLRFWWFDPGDRSIDVQLTYLVGETSAQGFAEQADMDLEYPLSLAQVNFDRLSATGRALITEQYRQSHFRVAITVVRP